MKEKRKIKPLLLDSFESAMLTGISRAHFLAMHSSGRLGPLPVRLGRRTLWQREEIEGWIRKSCPSRDVWLEIQKGICR